MIIYMVLVTTGGMPQMVFEYILRQNGINPATDLTINQSIDFGSTAAAFSSGQGDFSVEFEPAATSLEKEGTGVVVASLGTDSGYVPYTAYCAKKALWKLTRSLPRSSPMPSRKAWSMSRSIPRRKSPL